MPWPRPEESAESLFETRCGPTQDFPSHADPTVTSLGNYPGDLYTRPVAADDQAFPMRGSGYEWPIRERERWRLSKLASRDRKGV
jgi:hypothetical protein